MRNATRAVIPYSSTVTTKKVVVSTVDARATPPSAVVPRWPTMAVSTNTYKGWTARVATAGIAKRTIERSRASTAADGTGPYGCPVRARAPASAANLGPGFDTLAIALSLYVEVDVEPADRLTVLVEGEGEELPADASHVAARIAMTAAGTDRLSVRVRSQIPVGRGLGSSAAVAAAAAAAAGAPDPLGVAAANDGHPENAAASVLGGLVAAATVHDHPLAARLPLDRALVFVVLVPDQSLPTARARQALPAQVPHGDAAFNLGRMGLLVAGLADHRALVRHATDDRLHQAVRQSLFPQASRLQAGLIDAGALASCWSGAGPSVLGICTRDTARAVREAGEALLREAGVRGRALLLEADTRGLLVGDSPPSA
jgi:homoserine kinase